MNDKYKATENEWNELFEIAKKMYDLKMWDVFDDLDFFKLYQNTSKGAVYVTIMGMNDITYGVSLAFGQKGLYGLNLMKNSDNYNIGGFEIGMRQDALSVYYDDNNLEDYIMEDLKENYHYIIYDNKIVYFKRYQNNHFPRDLERTEVLKAIKYYNMLIDAYNYYFDNKLDVDFIHGEIYVYYINKKNEVKYTTEFLDEEVCDSYGLFEEDIKKYKKYPIKNECLEFSIKYLEHSYSGYHKYAACAKMFFLLNHETGEVCLVDCIKHDSDEGTLVLDVITEYIESMKKRPKKIVVDNFLMYSYLIEALVRLDIKIEVANTLEHTSNILKIIGGNIDSLTIDGVQ